MIIKLLSIWHQHTHKNSAIRLRQTDIEKRKRRVKLWRDTFSFRESMVQSITCYDLLNWHPSIGVSSFCIKITQEIEVNCIFIIKSIEEANTKTVLENKIWNWNQFFSRLKRKVSIKLINYSSVSVIMSYLYGKWKRNQSKLQNITQTLILLI